MQYSRVSANALESPVPEETKALVQETQPVETVPAAGITVPEETQPAETVAVTEPVAEPEAPEQEVESIPSLEELGYENVKMGTTFIVWAPKGADPAVYEAINKLFNGAYNDPKTKEAFAARGDGHILYGNLEETVAKLTESYNACEAAWNDYMASQG